MADRDEARVHLNPPTTKKCSSQSPEKLVSSQPLDKSDSNNLSCSTGDLNGKAHHTNGYFKDSSNSSKSRKKYSNEIAGGASMTPAELEEEYDGLIHVDTSNASNTLQMLNVLRKNRQLCDLILQLDDDSQDIYCHQIILACNSKFFMEIFNNYDLEQANNKSTEDLSSKDDENKKQNGSQQQQHSTRLLSTDSVTTNGVKKNSLLTIVNTNLNSTHRQLLFCLSDYLRNFLSDNYHHHYAKLNSIINHNSSHHHHHNHHHTNAANYDQDEMHRINQNLDYEALKICIDYMYKSELKVPSYLLPHVYTLAYHLSFENIVQACANHLTKHLSVDNCLSIRSFALDENLIQSSTQCIEKNIEYILQLKSQNFKSSNNSLSGSLNKLNGIKYIIRHEKYIYL
jgi:hypothetical protein